MIISRHCLEQDFNGSLLINSYSYEFGEDGYHKLSKQAENCTEHQKGFVVGGLVIGINEGINWYYRSNLILCQHDEYWWWVAAHRLHKYIFKSCLNVLLVP